MSRWGAPGAGLALALALGAPREASANGAFPSSGQVLVDPTDPQRIWVRTSYGFAKTIDGGESFQLVCEDGVGYSFGFHPHAALSATGAIFMGLSDGLAIGRGDTCAFQRAPELEGSYIVDVSMGPDGRAIVVAVPPNGGQAQVFASTDDLATWQALGAPLPEGMSPFTLDAAPSDPDVLYVSGTLGNPQPLGVLLSSSDAGSTWQTVVVPNSDAEVAPFIGGVDPALPGRLYVRLTGIPGRLLLSEDFGQTFTPIAQTEIGRMAAFRLAPDGASAIFGGNFDGLHRLDTATFATEPLAAIQARCVAFDEDRVFACGEEAPDGFTAGVSTDGGATFAPLLRAACIEGIVPCDAGAPVFDQCEPSWPTIAQLIGATGECDAAGAGGAGGAPQQAGGAPASGGAATAGGAGAGGDATGGGGGAAGGSEGCSCGAGPSAAPATTSGLGLFLALVTSLAIRARGRDARLFSRGPWRSKTRTRC